MEKLDQIIRKLCPSNRVKLNPKDIRFVGTGAEGTVYKIDEELCIKIYHRNKKGSLKQGLYNQQLGNTICICPKVFLWGEDYFVMEYFSSPSLLNYLKKTH